MNDPVTLPFWQLLLLALLAAWASVTLLLMPGARWFLRRRVNRVLERVDERLSIRLQPFKMTKRQVLLDRLIYDPAVLAALEEHLTEEDLPRDLGLAKVERYAREIVPAFNAWAYFSLGYWLSRRVARSLYRLRLGSADDDALERIDRNAAVVFVMNHRSNMDYILVSYLTAQRTALSYAVGEWARIWPVQQLVRSMGAYFVRRRSRNALYRTVLMRYVQMATESGVTQAVFPEGGLTTDGKLREPKLGLYDYMLRAFDPDGERDLCFVPIGLNYDRTLEDRTLLLDAERRRAQERGDAAADERPSKRRAAWTTLRFIGRNLGLMLRSEWHRFGYACVNFGRPVSLRAWLAERDVDPRALAKDERFEVIAELADELMEAIGAAVPVLPVALVAEVFAAAPDEELDELELGARVLARMHALEARGACVHLPRTDRAYAVHCGLRMLTLRRIVLATDGRLRANPDELELLRYYANSIAHLDRPSGPRPAAGPGRLPAAESAPGGTAESDPEPPRT